MASEQLLARIDVGTSTGPRSCLTVSWEFLHQHRPYVVPSRMTEIPVEAVVGLIRPTDRLSTSREGRSRWICADTSARSVEVGY